MTRLLDLGLDKLSTIIYDVSNIAKNTVREAVFSYTRDDITTKEQIFESSAKIRFHQTEVSELCLELITRFQPVSTDLRLITSYMEISYGFSRFGRYAYDIINVVEILGPLKLCDKSAIVQMSEIILEMIDLSIHALRLRDKFILNKIFEMEETVDILYRKSLRESTRAPISSDGYSDLRCNISTALILKYLERISDHASYIADSVSYIETGIASPRR